jgi:adenylate kinase
MVIIILGLPGSGKGTQVRLLSKDLGIPFIGFSDLLRNESRKAGSQAVGIRRLMDGHKLAPTILGINLIAAWLSNHNSRNGFILEGFPKSRAQAVALDKTLSNCGIHIDRVFYLDIPIPKAVERLARRAICPNHECGQIFSIVDAKRILRCDVCGESLIRRIDDAPEIAMKRCSPIASSSDWLEAFYGKKFHKMCADGPPIQVMNAILKSIRVPRK